MRNYYLIEGSFANRAPINTINVKVDNRIRFLSFEQNKRKSIPNYVFKMIEIRMRKRNELLVQCRRLVFILNLPILVDFSNYLALII